ncbi:hypothetical protein LAZ67_1001284 [Cordylochernes scorpioides]|uniref:Reverse transcriptase domain-containing protein n=1 Tax=Cordylochernes scorpioides TaxID=51811 RepID=A0ABY6JVF2_9ARAC|nr:hypothetical protein LAZ67_1001284 [Cordylochernes scorpioides]
MKIDNLNYADDTTLLSENKEDLKEIIEKIGGCLDDVKKKNSTRKGRNDEISKYLKYKDKVENFRGIGEFSVLMLGKFEGREEDPAMSWLERVKEITGRSLDDLGVMVTNRSNCRIFVPI